MYYSGSVLHTTPLQNILSKPLTCLWSSPPHPTPHSTFLYIFYKLHLHVKGHSSVAKAFFLFPCMSAFIEITQKQETQPDLITIDVTAKNSSFLLLPAVWLTHHVKSEAFIPSSDHRDAKNTSLTWFLTEWCFLSKWISTRHSAKYLL